MNWDEWVKKYKPITNPYNAWDSIHFETYGEELEYINNLDVHYVWTALDCDGLDVTVAGRAFVNRMNYYVTEVAWTDEDMNLEIIDEELREMEGANDSR